MYIQLLISNQSKEVGKEDDENNQKDFGNIQTVALNTVYEFLIKKRLVPDRSNATKLVASSLAGAGGLQTPGKMCYEEFNKLFCKGMFKVALINTLDKLQHQGAAADSAPETGSKANADFRAMSTKELEDEMKEDAKLNFYKEMPLSLKIERYQRDKMLKGLDPTCLPNQKEEVSRILMSLKYIQQFEENVDDATQLLRDRSYDAFMEDPTGANLAYMQEREKKLKERNVFA